tara:strand:- start:345 stop:1367 length:1023 start_codon:yes stop_codon:yes gene_type:complete
MASEEKNINIEFESFYKIGSEPIDTKWLIDGWLEEESIAFIYGNKNEYKSYIALTWAFHLHQGMDIGEYKVNKDPKHILFVATEGRNTLANRFNALKEAYKQEGTETFHNTLYLSKGESFNWDEDYINAFCELYNVDISLVIIDSLSASLGNETLNSDAVVRKVFNGIKKIRDSYKATVLIVAHTGKDTSRDMMGSAVLINDADTAIKVNGSKKKLISLKKQRNASKDQKNIVFAPFPTKLENGEYNLYINFDKSKLGLGETESLILKAYRSFETTGWVAKKEVKRVYESYLYPSGIVPKKERDSLRSEFNRKANNLKNSERLFEKIQRGAYYYCEEKPE